MQQRASPRSAGSVREEEPHLTYDELSMQRSRHFTVALQELKNLRPQLYSAAEYFESSYQYSDQKQVVLDNLKDYSVKALVNAVDHLGTVAYKLNDLLAQEDAELAATQTRSDSLTQRLRACQEHSDREGMKQQSLIRTCPRNYSHYVLVDPLAEEKAQKSAESFSQTFDPEQLHPVQREQTPSVTGSKSLLWHLSTASPPSTQGSRASLASSSGNGRPESAAVGRDSFLSLPLDLDSTSNPSPASVSSPSALHQSKIGSRTSSLTATPSSNSTASRNVTAEVQAVAPVDNGSNGSNGSSEQHPSSKSFFSSILGRRGAKQS